MCTEEAIRMLLELLRAQPVLAPRGYTFHVENGDELLTFRGSHLRGIWRCCDGEFAWTPAGYTVPTHTVRDVEAALRYTLVAIATTS